MATTAQRDFAVDAATNTIRFIRDLAAPPERVFQAWTMPAEVACWWDATGEKLAVCEIDLRLGGAFRFVTAHHPDKPFTGIYRTIECPGRLVFEANGAVGDVRIEALGSGTRMTVEIVSPNADHLAHFVQLGIAAGTARTLDNLVGHLGH